MHIFSFVGVTLQNLMFRSLSIGQFITPDPGRVKCRLSKCMGCTSDTFLVILGHLEGWGVKVKWRKQ
jgi:hypothetical protein